MNPVEADNEDLIAREFTFYYFVLNAAQAVQSLNII